MNGVTSNSEIVFLFCFAFGGYYSPFRPENNQTLCAKCTWIMLVLGLERVAGKVEGTTNLLHLRTTVFIKFL